MTLQQADTLLTNAFTVDVEDYYHVSAFADRIPRSTWGDHASRVVRSTHKVLQLLNRHQVRGTFFVLGWVAEHYPDLVRDIQRAGHEIGNHSYAHELVYRLTPDEFRADLRRANAFLEDITGTPVTAYRAPSFSITRQSIWALDVLAEEGFQYDSSIFPTRHDRYGIPSADPFPHLLRRDAGTLLEFPPSTWELGKYRLPVAGGGYFRLYPLRLTLRGLRSVNRRHHQPGMFYIHPWELDPEQPRLSGSRLSRFRHYVNLHRTEVKLDRLLSRLKFGSLTEALQSAPVLTTDRAINVSYQAALSDVSASN